MSAEVGQVCKTIDGLCKLKAKISASHVNKLYHEIQINNRKFITRECVIVALHTLHTAAEKSLLWTDTKFSFCNINYCNEL